MRHLSSCAWAGGPCTPLSSVVLGAPLGHVGCMCAMRHLEASQCLLRAGLNGGCRRGVLATVPSLHTCSCAVLRRGTTCLHPTKRLAGDDGACQVQVPRMNLGALKAAQINPQLQPGPESPTPASCCHIKIRIQGSGRGHIRLRCVDGSFPGHGPRDKLGSAHTLCAGKCGGSGQDCHRPLGTAPKKAGCSERN